MSIGDISWGNVLFVSIKTFDEPNQKFTPQFHPKKKTILLGNSVL